MVDYYHHNPAPYITSDWDSNQHRIHELEHLDNLFQVVDNSRIGEQPTELAYATDNPYYGVQYPSYATQHPTIYVSDTANPSQHASIDPSSIPVSNPNSTDPMYDLGYDTFYLDGLLQDPVPVPESMAATATPSTVTPSTPVPVPAASAPAPRSPVRSTGRVPLSRHPSPMSTRGGPSRNRRDSPRTSLAERKKTCVHCRRGKIKCRPSPLSDRCVNCEASDKECIPAETRSRPNQETVASLERRIRKLHADIEDKMVALGATHAGEPGLTDLDSHKPCDCAPGEPHRQTCRAADPQMLFLRAQLMELLSADDDAEDSNSEDQEVTSSESDDRYSSSPMSLSLPLAASGAPVGIFFELAQQLHSPTSEHPSSPSHSSIGLAGADYFTPGPAARPEIRKIIIEQGKLPPYMVKGEVPPALCRKLFERFIEYWNVSVSVLDPKLHTAKYVLWRCPFLFTVVLAIAARDHPDPKYYPLLMQEAKNLSGLALVDGWKTVEMVQAFILLATFPPPSRRWDEDRTWMYLGCAIRMATDMDLCRPAEPVFANEVAEREYLNRTRTWMICHNLEVSASAKLGKVMALEEDAVIQSSNSWWKSSKYNMPFDLHLCAFTQICMIFHRYYRVLDPRGGYGNNVEVVVDQFTKEIDAFQAHFEKLFEEKSDHNDEACKYRAHVRYTAHYFRLVIYSKCHGLSSSRGSRSSDNILLLCKDAASQLVKALTNHHANSIFFKFSAEGWFTFGAFAAAFIIKLLCPGTNAAIDTVQHEHLRTLVVQLISAYSSPQIAIDDNHTPAIYARFLSRLLARADELSGVAAPPTAETPRINLSMDDLFGFPSLQTLGS